MAVEWGRAKISQVAHRVTKGTTPTTIGGRFVDAGIAFVKVESILGDGRLDAAKLAHIDEDTNELLSRSALCEDDVLFTIAGTIGRVAMVPPDILPANTNQAVAIVRPNHDVIHPRFLYYALRDGLRVRHAHSRVVQSVQANFSLTELGEVEIPLPPKQEQLLIAGVLGALDDKIDVNRRIAETLEEIARMLFKSWFVDFDPVRGSANLPDGMRQLFPDRLIDSAIGPVPEGWEVADVSALASRSHEVLDPRRHPDEEFDHYSIPAFDAGKMPIVAMGSAIKSTKLVVPRDSVMVSKLNPRFPRVWWTQPSGSRRAIASTEFVVAMPRPPATRAYLYGLFTSPPFRTSLGSLVRGTSGSHQRVAVEDLLRLPIVAPPENVVSGFDAVAAPLFRQKEVLTEESKTLAGLRDALLPKLISGDIRLPAA